MRVKKPKPPLEREVLKLIVEYFALKYRIKLHRRNTGAMKGSHKGKGWFVRFSEPGQSDLWGIEFKTGRHVEIECKRFGETPTPLQLAWLEDVRILGGIGIWADSIGMAVEKYEEAR